MKNRIEEARSAGSGPGRRINPAQTAETIAKGADLRLQRDVLDDKKIVAVWLTRAEDANETVRARIDGLCREHKPKKCQVAVYKSGAGGL